MATTTNFGWETPDDTDLVKDGALAMRTLGNSIDSSFVDLKGGTTGQVLAKASNTDLDYTWVTQDDANAIQNAIVDAKGDLIAASAADTPARLAVGNNGETLVADSSTSTGLRWQGNFAAGKNKVINGDFGIWQRGTSFTNPANSAQYTADRFQIASNAATTTHTVTRETFTPGTAPVAGYEGKFFYRSTLTNIGSATVIAVYHKIEDVQTLAGQTATVSFWAKADSARNLSLAVEQVFGSGGSANVTVGTSNFTLSTSWTRFSVSYSVPSISGKTIGTNSNLLLVFNQTVTNGSVLDLWGVQVEAGNVATAFQTATGTLAGELAACQRYFQVYGGNVTNEDIINLQAYSSTQFVGSFAFNEMRIAPTFTIAAASNFDAMNSTYGAITATAFSAANISKNRAQLYGSVASGLTAGNVTIVRGKTTASTIQLSAEL